MRYSEWNKLTNKEKEAAHWKQHPRIRIATIFSIVFAVFFLAVMLRVLQNRRIHVNRKPNAKEAYAISKAFINDKLKQPSTATFPKNKFASDIDTANNIYRISSYVNAQDSSGKIKKSTWRVKLSYTGGDWAEKNSWHVDSLNISQ